MSIYRRKKKEDDSPPVATHERLADAAPVGNEWVGLGAPDGAQVDQYSAWAERMRSKRSRNQEMIDGRPDDEQPGYWNPDTVFTESERVAQEEISSRPDPLVIHGLLKTLDLSSGATSDEISAAYKNLVKRHHPDRYVQADEPTRSFHDERMREITTAYRSLRTLGPT